MVGISDTKQKLMDATRRMIDNGGVSSVSMRKIGNEAQLSRSAVYRYFKSKEDLLAAIVIEDFKILKKIICDLIRIDDDPIKTMSNLLKAYYDFGVKNKEHYRLMFDTEWDKAQYPDVHGAAFEIFDIVSTYAAAAQEQKRIINKQPIELTAMAYAFIYGLIELSFTGHYESEKGLNDPYSLIDSFLSMLNA
jgi:AcrR family transcriptional regulator